MKPPPDHAPRTGPLRSWPAGFPLQAERRLPSGQETTAGLKVRVPMTFMADFWLKQKYCVQIRASYHEDESPQSTTAETALTPHGPLFGEDGEAEGRTSPERAWPATGKGTPFLPAQHQPIPGPPWCPGPAGPLLGPQGREGRQGRSFPSSTQQSHVSTLNLVSLPHTPHTPPTRGLLRKTRSRFCSGVPDAGRRYSLP